MSCTFTWIHTFSLHSQQAGTQHPPASGLTATLFLHKLQEHALLPLLESGPACLHPRHEPVLWTDVITPGHASSTFTSPNTGDALAELTQGFPHMKGGVKHLRLLCCSLMSCCSLHITEADSTRVLGVFCVLAATPAAGQNQAQEHVIFSTAAHVEATCGNQSLNISCC